VSSPTRSDIKINTTLHQFIFPRTQKGKKQGEEATVRERRSAGIADFCIFVSSYTHPLHTATENPQVDALVLTNGEQTELSRLYVRMTVQL